MAMSRTTINDSTTNPKCDQNVLNKFIKEEFSQIDHTNEQLQIGCDQDLSNSFIKEEFTQLDHTNDQSQIGTIYEAEVKSTDKEIKVEKDFIESFAFQGSVESINSKNNLTDFRTRSIPCDTDKHYSGKKTYECDICNLRFTYPSQLKTHAVKHTIVKSFECIVCLKKFCFKSVLDVHMRIHTGEAPYKCHICSRSFSTKCNLKMHLSTHTYERPFECDICSSTCISKSYIKRHILLNHNSHYLDKIDINVIY